MSFVCLSYRAVKGFHTFSKDMISTFHISFSFEKLSYSSVPNRRPPVLINVSIFFHPGHSYSNPPPLSARLLIIEGLFRDLAIGIARLYCVLFL